jgi:hypothetical protein
MNRSILPTLVAAALLAAGCGGEAADQPASDASPAPAPAAQVSLPDTTADAVWAMLTQADFQNSWSLWPGMGELYTGNEPHGMLLTTYMNDVALAAFEARAGTMPVGAVLVKENYMPDSTLAATTVMVKRERAYNPNFNGWWWLKRNADGSVDAAGKGVGCETCHVNAANDHIFTGPLSGGG